MEMAIGADQASTDTAVFRNMGGINMARDQPTRKLPIWIVTTLTEKASSKLGCTHKQHGKRDHFIFNNVGKFPVNHTHNNPCHSEQRQTDTGIGGSTKPLFRHQIRQEGGVKSVL